MPHYNKYWYEDLPDEAKKAATTMGYTTMENWDEDYEVPFDIKSFDELTLSEKRAATFLGFNPIKKKLDVHWSETSEATKEAAFKVGWSQEKWDDNWELHHLDVEHKYCSELTDEERAGVQYFGYTRCTWDQPVEMVFEDDNDDINARATAPIEEPEITYEPDEDEETDEETDDEKETNKDEKVEETSEKTEEKKDAKKKKKKKIRFAHSKLFGNPDVGDAFDDHNHRRIKNITIWSGSHNVDAIKIKYEAGSGKKHGGDKGKETSVDFGIGEYINKVIVRHASSGIHCLTFESNKGKKIGPCGGKGNMLLGQSSGEEEEINAPAGMQLSGIKGHANDHMMKGIELRWATIRKK